MNILVKFVTIVSLTQKDEFAPMLPASASFMFMLAPNGWQLWSGELDTAEKLGEEILQGSIELINSLYRHIDNTGMWIPEVDATFKAQYFLKVV